MAVEGFGGWGIRPNPRQRRVAPRGDAYTRGSGGKGVGGKSPRGTTSSSFPLLADANGLHPAHKDPVVRIVIAEPGFLVTGRSALTRPALPRARRRTSGCGRRTRSAAG